MSNKSKKAKHPVVYGMTWAASFRDFGFVVKREVVVYISVSLEKQSKKSFKTERKRSIYPRVGLA